MRRCTRPRPIITSRPDADGVHHFSETYYEHQNFLAELAGKTQPDEEQTDAPADGEEDTDTENQTDGQT